jgi:hypothetical protein
MAPNRIAVMARAFTIMEDIASERVLIGLFFKG